MSGSEALSAAIERLVGHFTRVYDRFDQIDTRLIDHGKRLDHVNTMPADHGRRLDHIDANLEAVLGEALRSRSELMSRLDRQQDLLTAIRDDIGVNMAATVRVQKGGSETRQDMAQLSEQVSLIHRRLMQLEERVDRAGDRP